MAFSIFSVVVLLSFSQLTSAVPVDFLSTSSNVHVGNSSCLTPEQDAELKKAITSINGVLGTTVAALEVAEKYVTDNKTKADLAEAVTVISAVKDILVANLTKIADSACGSCVNITNAVEEAIDTIQQTLSKIDPDWQKDPIWKVVFAAIDTILNIVKDICPSKGIAVSIAPPSLGNSSCLTPAQQKQLKTAIRGIDTVLQTAVFALQIAEKAESDPTIKADLKEAVTVITDVKNILIANLTKIANEACGTCDNITNAVKAAIYTIEQTLERIDPNWQKNPIWKAVFTAINAILTIVEDLCPSSAVRFPEVSVVSSSSLSAAGNNSCLTPAQQKQLKTAIKGIDGVLSTAIVALDIAAAAEPIPSIKADLKEAVVVITAVKTVLIANLTTIANEACGTCANITEAVNDAITSIEQTLEKIDPNWQNNPIWKAVFTAIHSILSIVEDLCPSNLPEPKSLSMVNQKYASVAIM